MTRLSEKDINYIRYDLRKRGAGHPILLNELVDHVCCDVELEMEKGSRFKSAYEIVLKELGREHFIALQNTTLQSENYDTPNMFKNTLKIMLRMIQKYRMNTAINIVGLSLGLCCFIIITLYVRHELTYDMMFAHSRSMYRTTMSSTVGGSVNKIPTSYPTLGPELTDKFPDIQKYCRIINYKYTRMVPTLRVNDNTFYEENVIFADSTFFELFDFEFLSGDPKTALNHPNSIVITEAMERKYFGDESALGKQMRFNNVADMQITGVLGNLPSNTHMQFDFLIPMSGIGNSLAFKDTKILDNWGIDWFWTYMIIPNPQAIGKIKEGVDKVADEKIKESKQENDIHFDIQPLSEVHLHSDFDYNTDLTPNGDSKNLYIFLSVGLLVLLMSSINFINITMAAATRRHKEVGISKVLGALKSQLRFQFLFESVSICLFSLLIAFFLVKISLPLFSTLFGTSLQMNFWNEIRLILGITLFTIIVGALSGVYPAYFVTSFEPQKVLKGVWKAGRGGANFRKFLVGIQIGISIFLIIGTVVIWNQLQFLHDKSLGYDKDQIIMLRIRGTSLVKSFHSFKNSLLKENVITDVTSVSEPIGREVQFMTFNVEGREKNQFVKILNVTHDFVKTMGLEIIEGRDFSKDNPTDSLSGFLINEAAARSFGWSDPVGKAIDHSFRDIKRGRVIGVVKDFNFEPLQKQIDPIIIWFGRPNWYAAVRIQKGRGPDALKIIDREWHLFEPDKPLAFQFLDESIQHVYEKEKMLSKVFMVFSCLSIFIAVLGLFGIVSFITEQRMAEIGIRKVMGASVNSILYILCKEYVILLILSFAIVTPISYYIINKWLESFAFRITWSPSYFLIGLSISLIIVISTVIIKGMRAALSDPVKTLRAE